MSGGGRGGEGGGGHDAGEGGERSGLSARERRLAEQLRANLKRRKAQQRARDAAAVTDGEEKPS